MAAELLGLDPGLTVLTASSLSHPIWKYGAGIAADMS